MEFQCFCFASGRAISKVDALLELYQPYQVVGHEVTVRDVSSANGSKNPFVDNIEDGEDIIYNPVIDDEEEDEEPKVVPEPPKFQCPSAGIFPLSDDCAKFYECIDLSDEVDDDFSWTVVQYECQSGLYFDPTDWNCTIPKDIHPPRVCPGAEKEKEEEEEDDEDNPTTATTTTVPDEICPYAGYFVHPEDCSEFYKCVEEPDGFSISRFGCPAGFIFDPKRILCVVPEEIKGKLNCIYRYNDEDGEAEEDDHDEDDDLTTNHATNSHLNQYGINIEAIDEPEFIEADEVNDDSDEPTTPGTPESAESTEKVEPVAEGGRPDPDEQTNEPPTTNSVPKEGSGENGSPEYTCPSDGYFPVPSDCRKYILCSDDFNTTLTCSSNEVYNSLLQECSTDWSVCPRAPTCTKDEEQLTDPDDAEYYFICSIKGQAPQPRFKVLRNRCPEYSIFDGSQQKCIPTEQDPEDIFHQIY